MFPFFFAYPPLHIALLFAAHPVHVEAVAGLVGAAELLCAVLALAALRSFALAASRARPFLSPASLVSLSASLLLALAAAFAKEVGLTVLASFAAYDWLLLSLAPSRRAAAASLPAAAARLACSAAAGVLYLRIRSGALGGDTLLTTYRIQDNHLLFLPTRLSTTLTVAHAHWRYALLLIAPVHLCADWNYRCLPPVTSLADPRNAGAPSVYACLLAVVALARPWALGACDGADGKKNAAPAAERRRLNTPPGRGEAGTMLASGESRRRRAAASVRAFRAAALLAAPLVPALNVLVWVGAYLAERLLYLPSVGFVALLAAPLARAMLRGATGADAAPYAHDAPPPPPPAAAAAPAAASSDRSKQPRRGAAHQPARQGAVATPSSERAAPSPHIPPPPPRPPLGARPLLARAAFIALLCSYCVRTVMRVPAWESDATLFAAAAATCPDGVRARHNAGVQLRHAGDCASAEVHFRHALSVQPHDNCGPWYEIGVCAWEKGKAGEAAAAFEHALACLDTAANAKEAVRKALSALHSAHPGEPAVYLAYARVAPRIDPFEGEEQACAAAGAAALILQSRASAGAAPHAKREADAAAAEALRACRAGPAAAVAALKRAAAASAAAAAAQPPSPPPLPSSSSSSSSTSSPSPAPPRAPPVPAPSGLARGGSCDAASPAAAAAFRALPPTDSSSRSSLAVSFVESHGAACRGNDAYLKAVHAMQSGEPHSARLHLEWSRLLRDQVTRGPEADAHADFAVRSYDHAASHAEAAVGAARAAAAAAAAAAAVGGASGGGGGHSAAKIDEWAEEAAALRAAATAAAAEAARYNGVPSRPSSISQMKDHKLEL